MHRIFALVSALVWRFRRRGIRICAIEPSSFEDFVRRHQEEILRALKTGHRPVAPLLLAALPVLAFAQVSPDDPSAFFNAVVAAIQGGQWRAVAVLGVIALVWVAKRYGSRYWPFLGTSRGGALLALAAGLVSTFAPAIFAGTPFSLKLVLDAVMLGVTAAGGWVVVRRLAFGEQVPPNPASPGA